MKIIYQALLYLVIFTSSLCKLQAQIHLIDSSKVDSTLFYAARKALNNLSSEDYTKGEFRKRNTRIPYRLLLPGDKKNNVKYPLVITLHNSSRVGTDNQAQLEPLARIWLREDIRKAYPCLVLAPQFSGRSSTYAPDKNQVLISSPSDEVSALSDLVHELMNDYPQIDAERVYLVGYSMGGSTVQNLLRYMGGSVAAVVSIAAVPDKKAARYMKRLPIWLIHGKLDTENPFLGSEILYRWLGSNPGLRFTEFSQLDHGTINIPFLSGTDIPKWLFEKRKR